MLQDYLSEFTGLHSQAEDLLSQLARREEKDKKTEGKSSCSPSSSVSLEREGVFLNQKLDSLLTKMKRCFSAIELELRCLPREERERYRDTVEGCRRHLELLQRKALLSGGKAGRSSSSSSIAARHKNTTDALRQGN
ncbi:snare region anchored in the vesicle membrane carboxy-terminal protein, partial [Cystoisospora suis]